MLYQRIRTFLEVASCLNFSQAAERLYISQQAVTKQIAALETKMKKEKQLNRKMELKAEIKRLKNEVVVIK